MTKKYIQEQESYRKALFSKLEDNDVLFVWLHNDLCGAPNQNSISDVIGRIGLYSLEELQHPEIQYQFSDSLKVRFAIAKVGTKIKIGRLANGWDEYVMKINKEQMNELAKQYRIYFAYQDAKLELEEVMKTSNNSFRITNSI